MELTQPVRRQSDDRDLADVLDLLQAGFAYMNGRIDPPSSLNRMTLEDIRQQCSTGEVWTIGTPVSACVFLTPKQDVLYLGKLCVDSDQRGRGLARQLVELALERARALNLMWIELQTRVELTDNHATFARLGFVETGRTAHPGYDRPTSITLRLAVQAN